MGKGHKNRHDPAEGLLSQFSLMQTGLFITPSNTDQEQNPQGAVSISRFSVCGFILIFILFHRGD